MNRVDKLVELVGQLKQKFDNPLILLREEDSNGDIHPLTSYGSKGEVTFTITIKRACEE